MKYVSGYCLGLAVGLCLASCAQPKSFIVKTFTYMYANKPGTIAIDDDGRPLTAGSDTTFLVYVETKDTISPEWKYAWRGNKTYQLTYSLLEQKSVTVGRSKFTGEEIKISAEENNKLWLLRFIPTNEKIPLPKRLNNNELMIQAVIKKSIINRKIAKPVQLFYSASQ